VPEPTFIAQLDEQNDPPIGAERITVTYADGRTEQLRLHEYDRLYALPGVYEQIVTDRLGCRSPWVIAGMLSGAADRLGWARPHLRVLDLAAGNGVSGEALAAEGLTAALGTDIEPAAREAALRDRPGLYDEYLTLDLLALTDGQRAAIERARADALCCVAPVGDAGGQLPAAALAAAVRLLAPDALIAYMHDPQSGAGYDDVAREWTGALGSGVRAEELERRRYVHRRTVNGAPYEMDGVVWRTARPVL
jgi:hypothetical protein